MGLLAIAIAPALAIILFILYRDKLNREPPSVLFISFLLGVLCTIPAFALELLAKSFKTDGINQTIIFAFLGVAFVEELVKFIPLRLYAFTQKSFDEPLDGIVHGIMIGMGFASLENILYVYDHGMNTGLLRMFTAIPGHAAFGVLMGYYVGKAKFDYKNRLKLLVTGILLASFFHGLYDACLFLTTTVNKTTALVLVLAAFTTNIVAFLLASRLIKEHRGISRGLYKHDPVFTIRNATVLDIPLIRTLAKQIWPDAYREILSQQQINYMMNYIYGEAALKRQMASGHQFIIIYNIAIPVGFISFNEVEPGIYKLQKIYILANQQGRGTGKFAVGQVIAAIKPKGAKALLLNVNKYNKAIGFYEKLGFVTISDEKIDIGQGYFMDDYVMEKKLENSLLIDDITQSEIINATQ